MLPRCERYVGCCHSAGYPRMMPVREHLSVYFPAAA
jgi:hypothetical protein